MAEEMVTIPAARLAELEALAKSLPETIEKSIKEYEKKKLEALRASDTLEKRTARNKRYIDANREAYNARRRERYRLKKGGGDGATGTLYPENR